MPVDGHLFRGAGDIVRRDELPLLDVDDSPGAAGRQQQVGLAAEKGRNLQDVRDFGGGLGLRGLVNVGQDGEALGLDARQDAQALARPGPR